MDGESRMRLNRHARGGRTFTTWTLLLSLARAHVVIEQITSLLHRMSPLVRRFSAAGMQVYPRAEAAGGRKAPRHEVAGG